MPMHTLLASTLTRLCYFPCLVCSDTYINFTLAMTQNVGIDDGYDADVYDLVRPTLWGMGVAVEWGQG